MELELLTDRLLLRPLRLDDLDVATEMFTDPEVTRYAGGVLTAEEVETEMSDYIKRCAGGGIGIWCVLDRETSEKLGSGALLPIPIEEKDTNWDLVEGPDLPDREIEVGYFLKRPAWGKGYATEICMRLLAFAFEETPLVDVVACIEGDNDRSRHVLSKSGLRDEGTRRAYAEQLPCFRVTRTQWMSANRS
ncbi:MAG: GNAT family N-acetyltransferase [Deltaproteobacteria bacterium]|nr:GNAT family N-acetyltransferase [Deltaproteobacteria bacterium]MBW2420215.1 GNAT family N-acetyltransferase [Deltaproteobacteria bacterium]